MHVYDIGCSQQSALLFAVSVSWRNKHTHCDSSRWPRQINSLLIYWKKLAGGVKGKIHYSHSIPRRTGKDGPCSDNSASSGVEVLQNNAIKPTCVCVKLSLCFNWAPRLGTRWRWVVSFTPRPLYPQGQSPWHRLDRRLGCPKSQSGRGGEKNTHPLPGLEVKPCSAMPVLVLVLWW